MYLHYPGYRYNLLENSEQGIYTCRMPDAAGEYIDVSFGIYRQDYSGKYKRILEITFRKQCQRSCGFNPCENFQ